MSALACDVSQSECVVVPEMRGAQYYVLEWALRTIRTVLIPTLLDVETSGTVGSRIESADGRPACEMLSWQVVSFIQTCGHL